MSDTDDELVRVTINGKEIRAPGNLSTIQALWFAGYPRVKGVGCLEGVCGSCRILVRRKDSPEVAMALGCQTLIEDGMEVHFLVFPTPTHHAYQLDEIANSWEVQAQFHRIFPEAVHCRHCHGCDVSCPKGIEVEKGVELAGKGRFREASELFVACVMCDFCMTACPEHIAPNHLGLFARRVTAYFHIRPSNLISRLEELRRNEHPIRTD